jgi:hypothetical protein
VSALRRLGYTEDGVSIIEEELKSIVDFHNICVAVKAKDLRLTDLPTTWDLGSGAWLGQGLERLQVETVTREGAGHGKTLRYQTRYPFSRFLHLVCRNHKFHSGPFRFSEAIANHA